MNMILKMKAEDKFQTLKSGVSGIMRVKNDAEFVEACIDSCIEALDELIIVYNDCSDDTPQLVEKKRLQYPGKIKVYEYKHKVYSVNLSEEDYNYALSLPDNSPHLLCNYYNYALSKVSYSYAVKIDADQLYFTDQLKKWCDFCREKEKPVKRFQYVVGLLFNLYFVLFKQLCFKTNRLFFLLPDWLIRLFYSYYIEYARVQVLRGKACFSLSGINVIKYKNKWYVPLGGKNSVINILPPFNGEGDHLIFKVSLQTYYKKSVMPYYNLLTSANYSLIEYFVHPYKIFCVGFSWFHLNAMRKNCKERIKQVKENNSSRFMELEIFLSMKYKDIMSKVDKEICTIRQRTLFMFIYKSDSSSLHRFIDLLNKKIGNGESC